VKNERKKGKVKGKKDKARIGKAARMPRVLACGYALKTMLYPLALQLHNMKQKFSMLKIYLLFSSCIEL
jgi:hypothetical protein